MKNFARVLLGDAAWPPPCLFGGNKRDAPGSHLQHKIHYIASQKQGLFKAFPAGLALYLDALPNANKGPCIASHDARACI